MNILIAQKLFCGVNQSWFVIIQTTITRITMLVTVLRNGHANTIQTYY